MVDSINFRAAIDQQDQALDFKLLVKLFSSDGGAMLARGSGGIATVVCHSAPCAMSKSSILDCAGMALLKLKPVPDYQPVADPGRISNPYAQWGAMERH